MAAMPPTDDELKALQWRAWHRGTREADLMIGGSFDARHHQWGSLERGWFSALLQEQDVDIMAWAIGTAVPPERFQGPMMAAMQRLDYLKAPK
jgi:antitoxin CptB